MDWQQFLRLEYWLTGAAGIVHVMSALIALMIGPIVLLRERKGDIAHRVLGLVFVASMLSVNVSAFSMYEISGGWTIFHYLAVANLASIVPGFWMVRLFALTRDRNYMIAHATFMAWAYTGVVGAGVAQFATRILPLLWGETAMVAFLIVYFSISFALTAFLTNRFAAKVVRTPATPT
jgi:uncharacterized membrane protein